MKCVDCGSYAINHHAHGRDGSDPDLCDVCYWRKRAQTVPALEDALQLAVWALREPADDWKSAVENTALTRIAAVYPRR